MAKHTPGPWCVESVFDDDKAVDICLGYDVPSEGSPVLIASTYGGENEDRKELVNFHSAEANARLIAAAPELLEACRKAFDHMCREGDPFAGSDCDLGQMLSRVIRKAEGT